MVIKTQCKPKNQSVTISNGRHCEERRSRNEAILWSGAAIIALVLLSVSTLFAQNPKSEGRKKIEAAYAVQDKLSADSTNVDKIIAHWRKVARDPEVREDKDALAIAYGCEGMLELQRGNNLAADSLLREARPLFRYRQTKAYFLVALADLEKKLEHARGAMSNYAEILHTMDSMPQLEEIEFYRQSGYAPYAYGIVAALGVGQIAIEHPDFRKEALALLTETLKRHPIDALGVMSIVALQHIDPTKSEDYKFKLDFICSEKPDLRKVADKFAKQF